MLTQPAQICDSDDSLIFLVFFLRNDFHAVIVAAIFADSMRLGQFVAMRAFHQRGSRRFIIRKSFIRSALGLFTLGYCHIYTSCLIFFDFSAV